MAAMADTQNPESVTAFEVKLLELGKSDITEEKVNFVFETVDKLIPHLGIYKGIFSLCRDLLFDAVYSSSHTGDTTSLKAVSHTPYFHLVDEVTRKKNTTITEITSQFENVKEKLFEKQQFCEEQAEKISKQVNDLESLQSSFTDLQKALKNKENELKLLNIQLVKTEEKAKQIESQLNFEIADLKNDLNEAKAEIEYLKQYKINYDKLETAFLVQHEQRMPNIVLPVIKPVVMSKKTQLVSDIRQAVRLEHQLEGIQNDTIEEFDTLLKSHSAQLLSMLQETQLEGEFKELANRQIRSSDEELLMMEEKIKKCLDEMESEKTYLEQHKASLVAELEKLLGKQSVSWDADEDDKAAAENKDVDVINGKPEADPFIPQENIFSKYGAMVFFSSDQGRTYSECDNATFCSSCGEKTVVCPHKIFDLQVISFKQPATHIKIYRPKVRLNQALVSQVVEHSLPPSSFSLSTTDQGSTPQVNDQSSDFDATSMDSLLDIIKGNPLFKRMVPRQMSLEGIIELVEQFAGYTLFHSSTIATNTLSFQDFLLKFFSMRYLKESVALSVYYDFLLSLPKYVFNRILLVLAKVLSGHLDAAAFWYILHVSELAELVQWQEVQDFAAFAQVVYPFLNEDDLEALQMEYTSFSENTISASLVVEYIIYLMGRGNEPMFVEMEQKLVGQLNVKKGLSQTEDEFISLTDGFLALPDDNLRHQLFSQTKARLSKDVAGVPVTWLAQIASYLYILELMSPARQTVAQFVSDRRSARHADPNLGGFAAAHVVSNKFALLSLTRIQAISESIGKRLTLRPKSNSS
jgi:hypothetical protein